MYRNLYFSLSLLFALILSGSLTNAQTFDHNTGNIQVTVFENGYIGHGGLGAGGNGVTFMEGAVADVIALPAGIMYGNTDYGVSGMIGSLH